MREPTPKASNAFSYARIGRAIRAALESPQMWGVVAGAVVLAALGFLWSNVAQSVRESDEERARDVQREIAKKLARYERQSARNLSRPQTPEPLKRSPILGFGDSVGGRRTYTYVDGVGLRNWPQEPVLNSIHNADHGVGDERRFLRVQATATRDQRQVSGYVDRGTYATPGQTVYMLIRVDNNAYGIKGCPMVGPPIARDAKLQMTIWNSIDAKHHVVRAWISASNTKPKWITDAVAIDTKTPATLDADPTRSVTFSYSSKKYRNWRKLDNVQEVLDPSGVKIADGKIGSCWNDRVYMIIAFNQS